MALDAVMPDLTGMVVGAAASRPDTISGLDAEFRQSFAKMLKDAPEYVRNELKITSGYRSPELQEQLWRDALKKYGSAKEARKWVAPPGRSQHNKGMAKDLHYASDRTKEWVHKNAGNYGLAFPLKNEPWHIELATARKRDVQAQQQAAMPAPDVQGAAGDVQMTGQAGSDTTRGDSYVQQSQAVYEAFNQGRMEPEDATQYIRDVLSGTVEAPGPLKTPEWMWNAYTSGKMEDADRQQFEADVQAGIWSTPPQDMSFAESVGSLITGSGRRVESTEALPSWATMPEMNTLSLPSFKAALGTMMTSPEETVQVLKSNFPGIEVRQDAAGNYILKSSEDGQEYAIKPGVRLSDAPRIASGVLSFLPVGRATTLAGGAARTAAIEAGVQGTQAATGGDFDPEDVALAAGTEVGGRLVAQGVRAGSRAIGRAVQAAPTPAPAAAAPTPAMDPAALGDLIRQASRGGRGSEDAVRALVAQAQVNPQAAAAAKRLGIDLPPDALIDDRQLRDSIGLIRAKRGSEARRVFEQEIDDALKQADEAFAQIDGTPDISDVSARVSRALQKAEKSAKNKAKNLYAKIDAAVPRGVEVETPNIRNLLEKEIADMGGVEKIPGEWRSLYRELDESDITFARLDRIRKDLNAADARTGPYKDASDFDKSRLYAAMTEDQGDALRQMGRDDLVDVWAEAKQATQEYKQLQKNIVSAFGTDLQGSIATRLRTALTSAGKGDTAALLRTMQVIPEEMRKEAMATAIASMSSPRAGQVGFDPAGFSKFYTGLMRNKEAANIVFSKKYGLGPDAKQFMADMADIAQRLTDVRGRVKDTGQSLQETIQAATAEGLVEKALSSTILRRGAQAAAGGAGAFAGSAFGPAGGASGFAAGAGLARVIADIAQNAAHRDAYQAVGKMFASQQFKDIVEEAATNPKVADTAVRRFARSSAYRKWAKAINNPEAISRPERFIINLIQSARQQAQSITGEQE